MEKYLNFIYPILTFIIGFYLQYFISYLKTKGANQAHKEDKKELTTIVKSIEHRFINKIETLKVQLDNTNHFLKELKSEERKIILSIHSKLGVFYNFICDTSSFQLNCNDDIFNNIQDRSERFDSLLVDYHTLKVFIPEEHYDIIDKFDLCVDKIMSISIVRTNYFSDIINLNDKFIKDNQPISNEYFIRRDDIDKEFNDIIKEFINKFSPLFNDFTDAIRRYVKSTKIVVE